MEVSTIGVILFGCVALASILMLVVNAIDYIDNRKFIKEIRLKIKELKIKEIELNQ